jgi:hypothetical protein
MFKEVAVALKLNYEESIFHRTKSYILSTFNPIYMSNFKFYFSVIIDPRNGQIEIISKDFSLGRYKKEDLDKAKKEIIAKIKEKLDETKILGEIK